MATVKVKFRPSLRSGVKGNIYYQIIHRRVVRLYPTGYRIYPYEWDGEHQEITSIGEDNVRLLYLQKMSRHIKDDVNKLYEVIALLEQQKLEFTAVDILHEFTYRKSAVFLFSFAKEIIDNLRHMKKERTSEAYLSTLKSFQRFRRGRDVALIDFDSELVEAYESYLRQRGVSPNSSSFYLRNLRAIYNRAVEKDIVEQSYPFKHVYTGIERTHKRAISLDYVKKLIDLDLSDCPAQELARDIFLFSLYTRGMSFVDMAF